MPLFLDIERVPIDVSNDLLEFLYKADDDRRDGIWKPHESPFLRRLVELFTGRGLDRQAATLKNLLAWRAGKYHKPGVAIPPPAPPLMERWTPEQLAAAQAHLGAIDPALWYLEDNLLAVELVIQTYLPADALVTEAEWLATKATLMGRVEAVMGKDATAKEADAILQALPSTPAAAVANGMAAGRLAAVLTFAAARAAENVRLITESTRHRMRSVITADLELRAMGAPPGTSSLETKLADEFATLNRDWRRIAVTEAGEAQLQGHIASLKPGAKVKRVERYENACAFCRKIDGRIATVVAADAPIKDPETMIWPGKNNVGRSASPRKRVGDVLVQREPHEMWQLPAGLAHPHCRGRWVPVISDGPGDDPAFGDVLRSILSGK